MRNSENDRPTPKLEDEDEPSLIRENFLSSSKALKYKDEVANPPRLESPIVKSLFDFKGNEVYKEEYKAKPKSSEFSNPFKSAEPAVNPFANLKKQSDEKPGNPFAKSSTTLSNPF